MNFRDAFVILGTLSLFTGLALYSVALALIVLGVLLLAAGLWSHHVASRPPVPDRSADTIAGDHGD